MLKYWEKNIIPKIESYTKEYLTPIEYEVFLENIRMFLRKNNQAEAIEISFVLMDRRMPSNWQFIDSGIDYESLNIEEILVGEDVSYKLSERISTLLGGSCNF